jgi:glycosyltransferase involved in cell wall biosynthesis
MDADRDHDRSSQMRCLVYSTAAAPFVELDRKLLTEAGVDTNLLVGSHSAKIVLSILAFRPDVVISWFVGRHSLIVALACRLARRPHICIVSGYDSCSMPEMGYGNLRPGWRRRYTQLALRASKQIVAVSAITRDNLSSNLGRHILAKVTLVEHAVPARPAVVGDRVTPVLSCFSAEDTSRCLIKGTDRLIALAEELPHVQFVHIGSLPAQVLLPSNIRVTGSQSNEAVIEAMRGALVYLQPSRFESFGFAMAEAMSVGCLPVAFEGSGHLPSLVNEAGVLLSSQVTAAARQLQEAISAASTETEEQRSLRAAVLCSEFSEGRRKLQLSRLVLAYVKDPAR